MPVRGGAKLAAHLRKQQQAVQVGKVSVGVLGGRYPDNIPVGQVAAAHGIRPWCPGEAFYEARSP